MLTKDDRQNPQTILNILLLIHNKKIIYASQNMAKLNLMSNIA